MIKIEINVFDDWIFILFYSFLFLFLGWGGGLLAHFKVHNPNRNLGWCVQSFSTQLMTDMTSMVLLCSQWGCDLRTRCVQLKVQNSFINRLRGRMCVQSSAPKANFSSATVMTNMLLVHYKLLIFTWSWWDSCFSYPSVQFYHLPCANTICLFNGPINVKKETFICRWIQTFLSATFVHWAFPTIQTILLLQKKKTNRHNKTIYVIGSEQSCQIVFASRVLAVSLTAARLLALLWFPLIQLLRLGFICIHAKF